MNLPSHIDVAKYMLPKGGIPMQCLNTLLVRYPDHTSELCRFAFNELLPVQRIVFIHLFKQSLQGASTIKTSAITNLLAVGYVSNKDIQSALKSLRLKGYSHSTKTDGDLYWALSDSVNGAWLDYFKATYSPVIEDVLEAPMIIDGIGAAVRR